MSAMIDVVAFGDDEKEVWKMIRRVVQFRGFIICWLARHERRRLAFTSPSYLASISLTKLPRR
jgi:hypothetical protein